MSIQITTAMVDMFSSNIMHLSQQKGSRLLAYTRNESQASESKFYDRIGKRQMRRKEGRHSDVTYNDTPHSRRMVTMEDYFDADMVDQEDKIRIIMNPESEYVQAMGYGLGREYDEQIIAAGLGNAYGGKKGTTVIALPEANKIVACSGAGAFTGLNILTLRRVRKSLKQDEAIMKGEKVIFACAAQQTDDLLASTDVTSSDYNAVKTLVDGEVDTFMGFKFVETELLPFLEADITTAECTLGTTTGGGVTLTAAESRRCLVFTNKKGILLAKGREVNGRIDQIPGKHYAHQVYCALSVGGTRMEEAQVREVICYEV